MIDVKKVKKIMIEKDVSQTELALYLNISKQNLNNKFRNVSEFSIKQAHLLKTYFACNYEDIMHETIEEYFNSIKDMKTESELTDETNHRL